MSATLPAIINGNGKSHALIVPDDLQDLAGRATQHARQSIAASSRRAYNTDWQDFEAWCIANSLPALPTTPEIVGLYLTKRAETLKVATLQRRVVSISKRHKERKQHLDMTHPAIKETFAGIRRSLGVAPDKKAALRRDDLKEMLATIPAGLFGTRNRALLLVGFAGAFRRSELVALDVADLDFLTEGLAIQIRRSKTDQEGAGQLIGIPRGNGMCPVRALREWLDDAGITEGPVFRGILPNGKLADRLSDKAVARIVKDAALAAGLDPARFAGHSLRSGFATSASAAGADLAQIMAQTRHKSEAVARGYVQRGNVFQNRAVQSLGL